MPGTRSMRVVSTVWRSWAGLVQAQKTEATASTMPVLPKTNPRTTQARQAGCLRLPTLPLPFLNSGGQLPLPHTAELWSDAFHLAGHSRAGS